MSEAKWHFQKNFQWGYSTPYFMAGMYCTHVNNITYLLKNHRTNSCDMRNIIESLSPNERKSYDYNILEEKYLEYQNKMVSDEKELQILENHFKEREVLLLLPGRSLIEEKDKINSYITENHNVLIGVNEVFKKY